MTTCLDIMQHLKESTRELHQAAENHPFQQSLIQGTVSRSSYAAFLSQMRPIHEALEYHLGQLERSPEFRNVIRPYHFRTSLIQADLDSIGANGDGVVLQATKNVVTQINDDARKNANSSLGTHYVLEGSTNGSQFIARSIERAFTLSSGVGTSYLNPHKEQQQERWGAFKSAMSSLPFTDSDFEAILSSAQSMFRGLTDVSQALLESETKCPYHHQAESSHPKCPVAR